jgi:hypothetical protein
MEVVGFEIVLLGLGLAVGSFAQGTRIDVGLVKSLEHKALREVGHGTVAGCRLRLGRILRTVDTL